MALPATVERLEDLPELVREHYAQKEGVWTLTLLSPEEHNGLVTALNSERRLRRDADTQVTSLKTKFEGIEPDEFRAMQEKIASFADKEVYDKHGLEELVGRRTNEMKLTHERQMAAKDRELTAEREARQSLDRQWRSDRIETALLAAATKAGVDKGATPDAVARGRRVFQDLDEHGIPVAKDGEEVKYGKDGVSPFTPDEFMLNLKTEAPHLWPPSSGGGAPPQHGGVNGGIDYASISSPAERLTRFREAQAARRG
jgi:hypothetical protein